MTTATTTPYNFDASARFSAILKMARIVPTDDSQDLANQNAYAVGYLASMIIQLESELSLAKQEAQAAVKQLHEYVEAEGE